MTTRSESEGPASKKRKIEHTLQSDFVTQREPLSSSSAGSVPNESPIGEAPHGDNALRAELALLRADVQSLAHQLAQQTALVARQAEMMVRQSDIYAKASGALAPAAPTPEPGESQKCPPVDFHAVEMDMTTKALTQMTEVPAATRPPSKIPPPPISTLPIDLWAPIATHLDTFDILALRSSSHLIKEGIDGTVRTLVLEAATTHLRTHHCELFPLCITWTAAAFPASCGEFADQCYGRGVDLIGYGDMVFRKARVGTRMPLSETALFLWCAGHESAYLGAEPGIWTQLARNFRSWGPDGSAAIRLVGNLSTLMALEDARFEQPSVYSCWKDPAGPPLQLADHELRTSFTRAGFASFAGEFTNIADAVVHVTAMYTCRRDRDRESQKRQFHKKLVRGELGAKVSLGLGLWCADSNDKDGSTLVSAYHHRLSILPRILHVLESRGLSHRFVCAATDGLVSRLRTLLGNDQLNTYYTLEGILGCAAAVVAGRLGALRCCGEPLFLESSVEEVTELMCAVVRDELLGRSATPASMADLVRRVFVRVCGTQVPVGDGGELDCVFARVMAVVE